MIYYRMCVVSEVQGEGYEGMLRVRADSKGKSVKFGLKAASSSCETTRALFQQNKFQ